MMDSEIIQRTGQDDQGKYIGNRVVVSDKYILYAPVQSGKTSCLLHLCFLNYIRYQRLQIIVTRNFNDEQEQMADRVLRLVDTYGRQYGDQWPIFNHRVQKIDIQHKTLRNDTIIAIIKGHANSKQTGSLDGLYASLVHQKRSFDMYIDESDSMSIHTRRDKHQAMVLSDIMKLDGCHIIVHTTATPLAHIFLEQHNIANTIMKRTSENYVSHNDIDYSEIDENQFAFEGKMPNDSCIQSIGDWVEQRFAERDDDETNICLSISGIPVNKDHDRLRIALSSRFADHSILVHDESELRLYQHENCTIFNITINSFFKLIGDRHLIFQGNLVIITSIKSDGRGISFNSETTRSTWRITDALYLARNTDCVNIVQNTGRQCGMFVNKTSFRPRLYTYERNISNLHKMLQLQDVLFRKFSEHSEKKCSITEFFNTESVFVMTNELPTTDMWSKTLPKYKFKRYEDKIYFGNRPEDLIVTAMDIEVMRTRLVSWHDQPGLKISKFLSLYRKRVSYDMTRYEFEELLSAAEFVSPKLVIKELMCMSLRNHMNTYGQIFDVNGGTYFMIDELREVFESLY